MKGLEKLNRISNRREIIFLEIASQRRQLRAIINDLQRPLRLIDRIVSTVKIIKKSPLKIIFLSFLTFKLLRFNLIKKWLSYAEFAWRLIR